MSSNRKPIQPFAAQSDYITIHRVLMDEVMPILSPNAWKVLCFIIRKTEGWGKDQDRISYSQIMKGTGINSRTTATKAVRELMGQEPVMAGGRILDWMQTPDAPILIFCLNGQMRDDGLRETNLYSLNLDFTIWN